MTRVSKRKGPIPGLNNQLGPTSKTIMSATTTPMTFARENTTLVVDRFHEPVTKG